VKSLSLAPILLRYGRVRHDARSSSSNIQTTRCEWDERVDRLSRPAPKCHIVMLMGRICAGSHEQNRGLGAGTRLAHRLGNPSGSTTFASRSQEIVMSNSSKRIEGAAQKMAGKIKGAAGKLIDNEQMQAEGKATELKGQGKESAAKGAERSKGKAQQVGGSLKRGVGDLIDNEQMEAEGTAKELEGKARQHANR
jgi:uncharacterized protein YjbJ (UPF0337 family)